MVRVQIFKIVLILEVLILVILILLMVVQVLEVIQGEVLVVREVVTLVEVAVQEVIPVVAVQVGLAEERVGAALEEGEPEMMVVGVTEAVELEVYNEKILSKK
jgi:hypothetical protein